MPKTVLNVCGYCKEFKHYPLFKVPLAGASFAPDPEAAAAGLDVNDGVVHYSSFCLPCTRMWVDKLTEDFLTDGSVTLEQPGEKKSSG